MAQRKAKWQNDYIARTYDRINLTVPKGKKELIQAAAHEANESVNSYINKAIDLLMQGGSYGNSTEIEDTSSISRSISHTETDF